MELKIKNGSVEVKHSERIPRCLDIYTHLCGRETKITAKFRPALTGEFSDHDAYIRLQVDAVEHIHEIPTDGAAHELFRRNSSEHVTYLDIEQARTLRNALDDALGGVPYAKDNTE